MCTEGLGGMAGHGNGAVTLPKYPVLNPVTLLLSECTRLLGAFR